MRFWDHFKAGLALRLGAEAPSLAGRLLRLALWGLAAFLLLSLAAAVLKELWWAVLGLALAYAAWRWGRRRGDRHAGRG